MVLSGEIDNDRGMRTLGKYKLLRRLAVGGMAELFLAESSGMEGFQKVVALKRILPQLAANPQFVRMFLHEARLVARLSHPAICQVYDIGQERGEYFFSMEYVHGEDLRAILNALHRARRRLKVEEAVTITIGMAAGLHYAHEMKSAAGEPLGIVHRDVSPSNVMVTYTGHTKVLDFGVAKAEASGLHTGGQLKGSLAYMSPEQCRSEKVDRRSDVFAMGILLYELSTTSRLFKAETEAGILNQILSGKVPAPSSRRAEYPAELERIVMKALAAAPEDRYPTAERLQVELEEMARTERMVTSPVAMKRTMEELFGSKIQAWRKAQGAGRSLSQHLTQVLEISDLEFLDDADLVELAPSQSSTKREALVPSAAARRRRRLFRWAALSLLAGVILILSWTQLRDEPASTRARVPEPTPAPIAPAPPAEPPPPPPAPAPAPAAEAAPAEAAVEAPPKKRPPRVKRPPKKPRESAVPW